MVQAAQSGDVLFAFRAIGTPPGARVARGAQSAAAEALLKALRARAGDANGPVSKAHARTLAAAALAPGGRVGIDVEYRQPGRDIVSIATWLAGPRVMDEATAYRLFTFREAHFKAFGVAPDRALMLDVANARAEALRVGEMDIRFEAIGGAFMLALVWTCGGAPVRIRL
jgi:hypothetical protein